MTGTILENLSNRKLLVVVSLILLIQIASFLIGAIVAPSPSNTEQLLAVKCIADNAQELSIPRNAIVRGVIESKNCRFTSSNLKQNETIVYAFQLPLPREGVILDYSRWMSNLITILIPDFTYYQWGHSSVRGDAYINGTVSMNVRLAVKDKGGEWMEYKKKDALKRFLNCRIPEAKRVDEQKYDCEMMQLFELQSLFYDYYLINIQFGGDLNTKDILGTMTDVNLVAIHQNGGFTKIWLSMKVIFTAVTLLTLIWFCKRLRQLMREITLLERMLIVIGAAITQLNIPIEFFTLWFDLPFMNFLSDVRQGILYCALLSFWIIFAGEHLMDEVHRSRISSYFKQLSVVLVASIALFIFDSIERGIQWIDPFFSIWEVDSHLALIFIITASISSALYFAFLSYHIWLVLRNISSKQTMLPSMSSTRRLIYQGIIYRFKFLLLATLVCAAFTIIAYIMGQVNEEAYQFDDEPYYTPLQWSSAMFTTVYAMWNCYIITLLILYAPSHKWLGPSVDSMSEEIEFNRLTSGDDKCEYNADACGSSSLDGRNDQESDMKLLQDLVTKQSIE